MATRDFGNIIRWLKVSILELLADHDWLKETQTRKDNNRLTRAELVQLEKKVELQIARLKKLRTSLGS